MLSDDIFRLLLIILLLTNDKDSCGEYTSINDVVITALLLSSCNNSFKGGCGRNAAAGNCGCGGAASGGDNCGCAVPLPTGNNCGCSNSASTAAGNGSCGAPAAAPASNGCGAVLPPVGGYSF